MYLVVLAFFEIFIQLFFGYRGWGISNHGFSFGIGQNILPRSIYLVFVFCLAAVLIKKNIKDYAWWMVVAGGFSNGVVRALTGKVWDYIHWNLFFSIWFNFADILIVLGFIWMMLDNMRKHD